MTSDEHDYVQRLEALIKRYRRRIVELKDEKEKALEQARFWEARCNAIART